jgi:N-acetylglucosaminyldiphosphoundecaprenol N-acetyl-beta-D-mannosaminyltransferase
MDSDRRLLFGMHVDALCMDEVMERCHVALAKRRRMLLGVLNAAKIMQLRRDALLRNSLLECDLLLADGQSVVWASRLLRRPLPERVAGIDIFERLLALAQEEGRPVALLGARPDVLVRLEAVIARRYAGLKIAYSHHGYFHASEADAIAERIRKSGADMLFIGMTSPKKEIFLGTFGASLEVPLMHGVGGSFDVMAGVTRRAPRGWQKAGLEWAFRVLQEPRRLWWRYLSTNSGFIRLTAAEMIHPSAPFKIDQSWKYAAVGFEGTGRVSVERRA